MSATAFRREGPEEADYETACRWWSDARDHWTPIGWKAHFFRFNVLFNGAIVANPAFPRNLRAKPWAGQGLQVSLWPTPLNSNRAGWPIYHRRDNGLVRQGWEESAAPVLWTEWAEDGMLFRAHVFAHMAGGGEVRDGTEPLYAWVRLSVRDQCRPLPMDARRTFVLQLERPHVQGIMPYRNNLVFDTGDTAYPRRLRAIAARPGGKPALRVIEPGGKVRLAVVARRGVRLRFEERHGEDPGSFLRVEMDSTLGAKVDLLLPMLPTGRAEIEAELGLGYEGALRETARFWSAEAPAGAAAVRTPEPGVNRSIFHGVRLAGVIAETNPVDGRRALLTGTIKYEAIWAVNHALVSTFLLDCMGRHEDVGRSLEIFRDWQGRFVPPADGLRPHRGCFATPRSHACVDWLADHGAILYAAAQHALWSGDPEFIARWTDSIVAACEFVRDVRSGRNHRGARGLLPPGVCNDRERRSQAAWNDGWHYKGLTTAVRLLRRLGHPRAGEFAAEAEDYRRAFLRAFRVAARRGVHWTDAGGRRRPLPPPAVHADDPREIPVAMRHAFYLDAGPLFLVFAGLLRATDPLMESLVDWFRSGPPTRFRRGDGDACCWQLPSLRHEMSTCEPCFSWNLFHCWQRGQRAPFLEGLYSVFAGSMSRQTYVGGETRGGVYGVLFGHGLATYLARLSVIDDQVEERALHLLRLAPRAWLLPGRWTRFDRMPTELGPVTLHFRVARDGKTLEVRLRAAFRFLPRKVVLHVPPLEGVRAVRLNGSRLAWDGRRSSLVLPSLPRGAGVAPFQP